LQTGKEEYYNYGKNSHCDYLILPNSVELGVLGLITIDSYRPHKKKVKKILTIVIIRKQDLKNSQNILKNLKMLPMLETDNIQHRHCDIWTINSTFSRNQLYFTIIAANQFSCSLPYITYKRL